jgi:hypothetical protein
MKSTVENYGPRMPADQCLLGALNTSTCRKQWSPSGSEQPVRRGHIKASEVTKPYATTSQARFKDKPYREQSARPTIYQIKAGRLSSG